MKQHAIRRSAILILIFAVVVLAPVLALAQGTPPTVPHPIKNYRACLICHETGLAQAPQIPDEHAGYTNELCVTCHVETAAGGDTPVEGEGGPIAVPHSLEDRQNCLECHAPAAAPVAEAPPIPHPLEGRDDCLVCHEEGVGDAPIFPEDHAGRPSEVCQACHQMGEIAESVAVEGGPPLIPHTLVGRDDCLACHKQGLGGAPKPPPDHEGRPSDVCQSCHQPSEVEAPAKESAPAGPVPTPIPHPAIQGTDTCVGCHEALGEAQTEIVAQWSRSIHAERDVSCADCHGGDPNAATIDESMNPAAGYIGAPDHEDVPALCASCHADVALMRQYDLSTDQYAKYNESIHGIRLAQGDPNVATCSNCHGGHEILTEHDPASTVYPANVPQLCANCHADEDLMAPYGLPTNQYSLYKQSVHGVAMLEHQDFRAPNCATCHGTHGAAPPGFAEVSNVCGGCHSATQDHYLAGPHAKAQGGPECVTCHGRYDVFKPSDDMLVGNSPRECGSCHAPDSGPGQIAHSLYETINAAAEAYDTAEATMMKAKGLGMIVSAQENLLREANTNLITARATQHTADIVAVTAKTEKAIELAEQARDDAQTAIDESLFRRQAMIIAVIAIALVVMALYLLKRELDARLEEEEAG